jgi:hypothetical protein
MPELTACRVLRPHSDRDETTLSLILLSPPVRNLPHTHTADQSGAYEIRAGSATIPDPAGTPNTTSWLRYTEEAERFVARRYGGEVRVCTVREGVSIHALACAGVCARACERTCVHPFV